LADQLLPLVNAPTTIGLFHRFKILVGNLTQTHAKMAIQSLVFL